MGKMDIFQEHVDRAATRAKQALEGQEDILASFWHPGFPTSPGVQQQLQGNPSGQLAARHIQPSRSLRDFGPTLSCQHQRQTP